MKKSDPMWAYAAKRFSFDDDEAAVAQIDGPCSHCSCVIGQCPGGGKHRDTTYRFLNPDENGACPERDCRHNTEGKCSHPFHPANIGPEDLILEAL